MAVATIDYISDWITRLKTRLYMQFRDKTTWIQWCELLGAQFQDLEDAGQTLFTLLDIDNSIGTQLDVIGRIIGQDRLGTSDVVYRTYLKARVLANKSTGTPEDLYKVLKALLSLNMRYILGGFKEFVLRINSVIAQANVDLITTFVRDSKEAGARAIIEWQENETSSMFSFATAGYTSEDSFAFVYSYFVLYDSSMFPNSGTMIVDPGLPTQETFGFIKFGAQTLSISPVATMIFDHPINTAVYLVPSPGLGFDVGYFAGAAQA